MTKLVRMIDTVGQGLSRLEGFSYWRERPVLSYTTRSFAASHAEREKFPHFVGIDQAPTDALFDGARVKDGEPGAALNENIVRLARDGAKFIAYTFEANYSTLRREVDATGKGGNVWWWVAWWTANEQRAIDFMARNSRVVAVQWASPTFGGGIIVPGTSSTVRSLNVDLSIGLQDFWLPQATKPAAHGAKGIWKGEYSLDVEHGKWDNHGIKGENVELSTNAEEDYAVVGVDLQHGTHRIRGLDRETGKRLLG